MIEKRFSLPASLSILGGGETPATTWVTMSSTLSYKVMGRSKIIDCRQQVKILQLLLVSEACFNHKVQWLSQIRTYAQTAVSADLRHLDTCLMRSLTYKRYVARRILCSG